MSSNYYIQFYQDGLEFWSGNENDLAKQNPEWDGKLGVGDRFIVNGKKVQIISAEMKFPDSDDEPMFIKYIVK